MKKVELDFIDIIVSTSCYKYYIIKYQAIVINSLPFTNEN